MDIQKSLDKAEAQRKLKRNNPVPDSTGNMEATYVVAAGTAEPGAPEKGNGKWHPPAYLQSRHMELDHQRLAKNRIVTLNPEMVENEYYKVLRTNIQHRLEQNKQNAIMVTSVQPGEGKTLTAINLAISFSQAFEQTVLLVDCDLRRQSVHRYLNYSFDRGIVDYLRNGTPLEELIVWPHIEKLTVISGRNTARDSAELIGSPKMQALVREIKARYDDRYIIFDTPPVLSGADAIAFAPQVDGIIMVVEDGKTAIPETQKALEMIPKDKFMGFVLNRRKGPMNDYYYY